MIETGHGECLLRDPRWARIVAEALLHFHGRRVWTGDHVIMPNHVHALLRPLPGFDLEDILHSVKSFSALAIHRGLGRTGTLWQEESYDHIERNPQSLSRIQAYIRDNPVRAKLTEGSYLLSTSWWGHPAAALFD